MESLAAWLEGIGLGQYTGLFEQNAIDTAVLAHLTERDLAEIGLPLGPRRKIMVAIDAMRASAEPAPGIRTSEPQQPERRQLTVMFSDLVGSTALASRLDPEALRDLMQAYQQTAGAAIEKYGGHVAQYLGDGLLAYFGWPRAHEDDAERAVHAAREVVAAVKRVPAPEPLAVRIGIATGAVVVGETGAGDASVPKAAVGTTPNLAARLQALAGEDQIVVAPSTRRLLGDAFEFEDLGDRQLKGVSEPVRAARVTGIGRAEGRFEAARASGMTTFVGRDEELALLLARWSRARRGEGQAVLLTGEAGIGKSRLVQQLRERLAAEAHTRLRYQCSPYHTASAFHPTIAQLERAAGFERDDGIDERLDKLEAVLVFERERLPEVAPLFAALVGLPIARYPARMLSPQKQRELTIAALVDQALELARRQPVLMIFEDLHWADPSTLDTLALMIERMADAPLLLVATCRPEFTAPWSQQGHASSFSLSRLSKDEGAAIVERVSGGKPLPPSVQEQIVAKSDGIPLFVEELTKTVLEGGLLRDAGDRWVIDGPLPPLAIPSTLQDSLVARLDRLSPVKEVAQIGACIGREFGHELIAAVAQMPDERLQSALEQLVHGELVFRRGSGPEASYRFKHALVQDAAYETLLKSKRQQVHSRIAQVLQERFAETVRTQPELLALHLTQAGRFDEAAPQWIAAAQAALVASRNAEVLSHVAAGLAIVGSVAAERRADVEVALLTIGTASHHATSGYASEPARQFVARIDSLLDRVVDLDIRFGGYYMVGVYAWVRADYAKAIPTFERVYAAAQATGDEDRIVVASAMLGALYGQVGRYERCRELLGYVVEHYDVARHARFIYMVGNDIKVMSCCWLAWVMMYAGFPDQARSTANIVIEHATRIAYPLAIATAFFWGSYVNEEAGDWPKALDLCKRCIELSVAQAVPFWLGWALQIEGRGMTAHGDPAGALERIAKGCEVLDMAGSRVSSALVNLGRAPALALLGRFDEARRETDAGRAFCAETGEARDPPALALARAQVEQLAGDAVEAERWLQTALGESRALGNRMVELRAATALAKLWHEQGRTHEARELLGPVHAWYTEGFDTADLKAAKALLDELR